jgi:hypothetical protein
MTTTSQNFKLTQYTDKNSNDNLSDDFYENWMDLLDGLDLEDFFKFKNEFYCVGILYSRSISDKELESMKEPIVKCIEYIKKNLEH